jgi:hypothetical protein
VVDLERRPREQQRKSPRANAGYPTKGQTMNTSTKVNLKRATKTVQPKEIDVPDIETQITSIHIVGLSPLLINNFSAKTRQQIEDTQTGEVGKKGKKSPRNPEQEYQDARILDEKGRDCVPARYLKAAIVTAATLAELKKTEVRTTLFVLGDLLPIEGDKPRMRTDMVRVGRFGSKQPMPRYRAEYPNWSLSFKIQFEPRILSPQKLIYLVRRAGLNVGLCEWRPEKNGDLGRFDIKLSSVK